MEEKSRAKYRIGEVAEKLHIHERTIRIYEKMGLIHPIRKGKQRYFSEEDIEWISCLREMVHVEGYKLKNLSKLLLKIPCWELNGYCSIKDGDCKILKNKRV